MFVAQDREGRVVALTTDEDLASRMMTFPQVHSLRRMSHHESVIAEPDSFEPTPAALQAAKIREELERAGVDLKRVG